MTNISFEREEWNGDAEIDLAHAETHLNEYFDQVETGDLALFGFFKDGERCGSAIARIFRKNDNDYMEAVEVGGRGLDVKGFYFPFFVALAKSMNCEKFLIGTDRPAMKKFCQDCDFDQTYTEYEIDVEKVLAI